MINGNSKNGFTLIEAMVAIVILTLIVVGPLGVISHSISESRFASNKATAIYLAQEGIDVVANIAVNDWSGEFSRLISSCVDQSCAVSSWSWFNNKRASVFSCSASVPCVIWAGYIGNKFAGYDNVPQALSGRRVRTNFYRFITLQKIANPNPCDVVADPNCNLAGYEIISRVVWVENSLQGESRLTGTVYKPR